MRILTQSTSVGDHRNGILLAASGIAFLFGIVGAFGTVNVAPEPVFEHTVVEPLDFKAPLAPATAREDFIREELFQRGDTFAALLDRLEVNDEDAERLLRSPQASRSLRWLRPGTAVQARTTDAGGLLALWFVAGKDLLVSIDRAGDVFTSAEQQANLVRQVEVNSAVIRSSLFAATDAAGLSDSVATQIADIFAGEIDFHRDLRRGDRFSVVFEMYTQNGRAVKSGRVLAAEFINQNKSYRAVWFAGHDGSGGYYTPEGKNLRKAFLRSPLEFSRITSGFGMRMHPILQNWRAHKGVDYGAPSGTRVKATGDGVVEFIGRQGGYGNMVILRHAGGYTTAYGHLSGFARNMHKGTRIGQGDIIGYVGKTGWATGPHLHYEFRVNNQFRNPLAMSFPAAQPVPPQQLKNFNSIAGPLASQLDLLRTTNLALAE